MGQRHKHADVIIAWAEGKNVQVWDDINDMWDDLTVEAPTFMSKKYRIKPPTKKYRVALFRAGDEEPQAVVVNSQVTAGNFESRSYFVRWLTDWIEYEE